MKSYPRMANHQVERKPPVPRFSTSQEPPSDSGNHSFPMTSRTRTPTILSAKSATMSQGGRNKRAQSLTRG
jgi:hypothetical protein